MIIAHVDVFPLNLPMKRSLSTSGGKVGDKARGAPHVYVRVRDREGVEGWGEARPSHRWSYETVESVVSTIRNYFAPRLIGMKVQDLQSVHRMMNGEIKGGVNTGQPIAKAAVDTALHDLIGRRENKTLPGLWMAPDRDFIHLSWLISTTDPDEAAIQAGKAKEEGYRGVDVKIGLDPVTDQSVLEAVKTAAPDLFFRVDANQAYTLSQAICMSRWLEKLGVDVFEQPLAANNLPGHAELRRKTHLPVALDESVWTSADFIQALRLEACDAVVIKCTKMGGVYGAKRCGEMVREAGLDLLGGGLTESGLGLAFSAHLFNYLEIMTPVDLNGPFFLAEDPLAEGPILCEGGEVRLPGGSGVGCVIDVDRLSEFRKEVT
ncbi:muconate cycloisomerase [Melghirimyces profundicolus]|uniref:Muconate cycloisomerase n=1 Tax=Melghirimyces profundicolus TaxID=1242148 RepID=A0A2T6C9A4_9BACL|nr:enolase C-terminal domain-like protein [Melghirimyces profundicolus]PTX64894.1 muconate cycloisomerase [Melghirimyces profundicolus]